MSNGLGDLAGHLASRGRHGDTTLMHVNPQEIHALETITGKRTTINPHTGLPEAFSLWKTLAGVGTLIASYWVPPLAPVGVGLLKAGITDPGKKKLDSATKGGLGATTADGQPFVKIPLMETETYPPAPGYRPGVDPEQTMLRRRITGYSSPTAKEEEKKEEEKKEPVSKIKRLRQFLTISGTVPSWIPGHAAGGMVSDGDSDEMDNAQEIVAAAMAAFHGKHPEPDMAFSNFVNYFGPDQLDEFESKLGQGGPGGAPQPGMGGMMGGSEPGMDDTIEAENMASGGKVRLSGGEFVIPADVVSHLGDGNTNAGAKHLYNMIHRVRVRKTGRARQPGRMMGQRMLPS